MITDNGDGTTTVRLLGGDAQNPREVVLREPGMEELADIHAWVVEVDDSLPIPSAVGDEAPAEVIERVTQLLRERKRAIYDRDTKPYGMVLLRIVELLKPPDVEVAANDLPGSAMNPATVAKLLGILDAPLGG